MAEEEKKNWLQRAWDWRNKKIIEPQYKYLPEWAPTPSETGRAIADWSEIGVPKEEKKGNWKDFAKIWGNYIDWDRRMIGAAPHTLPRSFGFDYEFYNPFKGLGSENYEGWGSEGRNTLLPGLDVKADFELYNPLKWRTDDAPDTYLPGIDFIPDESMMGVGGADELLSKELFNKNLSLTNKDSAASKFLQQYDSKEAFQSYINDSMNDDMTSKIKKEMDKELNWDEWRQKFKYNDPQDFGDLQDRLYQQKLIDHFLDPYMKDVGEKYRKRMIDEFGAYDIKNKGYFSNLGLAQTIEIASREGDPFLVEPEWVDTLYDKDPENDQLYPEEFNFGAFDPLWNEIIRDFPLKYDEPEHYQSVAINLPVGAVTGGGIANLTRGLATRLPRHLQTPLKVLHPATSQLGKWATTRGAAQTLLAPIVSEKSKQSSWYPNRR
jgi:hypothetical protein